MYQLAYPSKEGLRVVHSVRHDVFVLGDIGRNAKQMLKRSERNFRLGN
jgi:hypothetical protein